MSYMESEERGEENGPFRSAQRRNRLNKVLIVGVTSSLPDAVTGKQTGS